RKLPEKAPKRSTASGHGGLDAAPGVGPRAAASAERRARRSSASPLDPAYPRRARARGNLPSARAKPDAAQPWAVRPDGLPPDATNGSAFRGPVTVRKQSAGNLTSMRQSGLYDPANEHDGCGVAMVVRPDNVATHETVKRGLLSLCHLEPRGSEG